MMCAPTLLIAESAEGIPAKGAEKWNPKDDWRHIIMPFSHANKHAGKSSSNDYLATTP
jgi:hypothetical protein